MCLLPSLHRKRCLKGAGYWANDRSSYVVRRPDVSPEVRETLLYPRQPYGRTFSGHFIWTFLMLVTSSYTLSYRFDPGVIYRESIIVTISRDAVSWTIELSIKFQWKDCIPYDFEPWEIFLGPDCLPRQILRSECIYWSNIDLSKSDANFCVDLTWLPWTRQSSRFFTAYILPSNPWW